jgi:hypothetical protein
LKKKLDELIAGLKEKEHEVENMETDIKVRHNRIDKR